MLNPSVRFRIFPKPVFDLILKGRRDKNQADKEKKRAGDNWRYQTKNAKKKQWDGDKAFNPAERANFCAQFLSSLFHGQFKLKAVDPSNWLSSSRMSTRHFPFLSGDIVAFDHAAPVALSTEAFSRTTTLSS